MRLFFHVERLDFPFKEKFRRLGGWATLVWTGAPGGVCGVWC